jgi:hypothetical protein
VRGIGPPWVHFTKESKISTFLDQKIGGAMRIPSPSIKAKRSAARSKSPRAFTAAMLGSKGTLKYFPAGNAYPCV